MYLKIWKKFVVKSEEEYILEVLDTTQSNNC
jgi:hypothetical protein